jgi:hypothetical protein
MDFLLVVFLQLDASGLMLSPADELEQIRQLLPNLPDKTWGNDAHVFAGHEDLTGIAKEMAKGIVDEALVVVLIEVDKEAILYGVE